MNTYINYEPLKYKYLCPHCKNVYKMSYGYFKYLKDNVQSGKNTKAGYTCPKCLCTDMNFIDMVFRLQKTFPSAFPKRLSHEKNVSAFRKRRCRTGKIAIRLVLGQKDKINLSLVILGK